MAEMEATNGLADEMANYRRSEHIAKSIGEALRSEENSTKRLLAAGPSPA